MTADFDEPDLDQILRHTSRMLERRDYPAIRILRRVFVVDPWTLPGTPINQPARDGIGMLAFARQPLADELVAVREPLLDGVAITGLRSRPTWSPSCASSWILSRAPDTIRNPAHPTELGNSSIRT